jgi:hypothetical protein
VVPGVDSGLLRRLIASFRRSCDSRDFLGNGIPERIARMGVAVNPGIAPYRRATDSLLGKRAAW